MRALTDTKTCSKPPEIMPYDESTGGDHDNMVEMGRGNDCESGAEPPEKETSCGSGRSASCHRGSRTDNT